MDYNDKKLIIERYKSRYQEYGYDIRTLGWNKGKQDIRFGQLTKNIISNNCSVLDIGCGFGDLYAFMKKRGWNGDYLGVDIVDELLNEAKTRHKNINVLNMDILEEQNIPSFDYVISSGIFNSKLENNDNKNYILSMLKRMFSLAKKEVAADFMSTYVDYESEIGWHTDPAWLLNETLKISRRVDICHSYLPYEFSVHIMQEKKIVNSEYSL